MGVWFCNALESEVELNVIECVGGIGVFVNPSVSSKPWK